MHVKQVLPIMKETFSDWNDHSAPRWGAALAFYTILSLSPLITLLLGIVGLIFDQSTAQAHILGEVQSMIGPEAGKAIQDVMTNAHKHSAGVVATAISVLTLLFGASGVFGELRSALNKMWDVTPKESSGIMGMLRERFFSFGMVLSIGFLLLVSLVISTAFSAVGKFFGGLLPLPSPVLSVTNFIVSFIGISLLFGLIFKFVPETRIQWRNVWVGAITTAVFFTVGKDLIGLYLGKAGVSSTYGAAGSLVVVVVWAYYSAQIFFFGAEFTHVYARSKGRLPTQRASLQKR